MMPLLREFLPRSGITLFAFLLFMGFFFVGAFNFTTHTPGYLIACAIAQGGWLGYVTAELHSFAGQLRPPLFAQRLTQTLAVIMCATLALLALLSWPNHELLKVLVLYISLVIAFVLLHQYIRPNVMRPLTIVFFGLLLQQNILPLPAHWWSNIFAWLSLPAVVAGIVTLVGLAFLLLRRRLGQPKFDLAANAHRISSDSDAGVFGKIPPYGLYGLSLYHQTLVSLLLVGVIAVLFWLMDASPTVVEALLLLYVAITPTMTLVQIMRKAPLLWVTGSVLSRQDMASKVILRALVSAAPMLIFTIVVAIALPWTEGSDRHQLAYHALAAFGLGVINLALVTYFWDYFSERLVRWPVFLLSYCAVLIVVFAEPPMGIVGTVVSLGTLFALVSARNNLSQVDLVRS